MTDRRAALRVVLALPVLLAACVPRGARDDPGCPVVDAGEGNRPWSAGTAPQQARIRGLVERLRTAKGEEALDIDRRIAAEGEPAVPALLEALRSEDAGLRGHAAYVLGYLKDRRTLPALHAASKDPVPVVRYEAAAALLELGDARGFPVLVDGLEDADARRRAKCVEVLAERTGQRFGFEPAGGVEDRAAAVRRWRAWLAQGGREAR